MIYAPWRGFWERSGFGAPAVLSAVVMLASRHSLHSSFREKVLEHRLVGELLCHLWLKEKHAEVLKPEVDDAGYDLLIDCDSVIRHIQLKTSYAGAATKYAELHLDLAQKPSGCVIWMIFDPSTMGFNSFLWFGNPPGQRLPDISLFPVAKQKRGDSTGVKGERPDIRKASKGKFEVISSIPDLCIRLFG